MEQAEPNENEVLSKSEVEENEGERAISQENPGQTSSETPAAESDGSTLNAEESQQETPVGEESASKKGKVIWFTDEFDF